MKNLLLATICTSLAGTCCLVSPAAATVPPTEPAIAILSKIILDVSRKEAQAEWTPAKMGETLGSGDRVRTGERSVAIIKFKDNSLVRVRQFSEVTVTGSQSGASFSKAVNVEGGAVGFDVAKQRADEEFRFTSPTSVASIRGTSGLWASLQNGDTLTILTGLASLRNVVGNNAVDVPAGYIAFSNPDGTLFTRLATQAERNAAEDALRTGDQPMRLEFELHDNQGKTRNLLLDYKQ